MADLKEEQPQPPQPKPVKPQVRVSDVGVDMEKADRLSAVSPGLGSPMSISRFNTRVRNTLRRFDANGDGKIDVDEITQVVEVLVNERFKSKLFKIALIVLLVFTVILLGAMFGLTWAVVAALKDTEVDGNLLVSKSDGKPVLVANSDLLVEDGLLVQRNSSTPVRTAAYSYQGGLNANTSFEALKSLKQVTLRKYATLNNKTLVTSQLAINVLGVARIPANGAVTIRVLTAAGDLILEQGSWKVDTAGGQGQFFIDAGFGTVPDGATGRRRLLQEEEEKGDGLSEEPVGGTFGGDEQAGCTRRMQATTSCSDTYVYSEMLGYSQDWFIRANSQWCSYANWDNIQFDSATTTRSLCIGV